MSTNETKNELQSGGVTNVGPPAEKFPPPSELPKPLPVVYMTDAERDALPEYSHSLPTRTTLGKTWRRRVLGGWLRGCYVLSSEPGLVGIEWARILPPIQTTIAPEHELPKGPQLGRFSPDERAELDDLKRKAFEAAAQPPHNAVPGSVGEH